MSIIFLGFFKEKRGQKTCLHNIEKWGTMSGNNQGSFPHYPQAFPQAKQENAPVNTGFTGA